MFIPRRSPPRHPPRAPFFPRAKARPLGAPLSFSGEVTPTRTLRNIFVLQIEVKNASGDPVTEYISTKAMITRSTDTPAEHTFRELVDDPGTIRTQVFGSDGSLGIVAPVWGGATFKNTSGALDAWLDYTTDDGKVTCWYGPYGGAFPAEFRRVYIARIDGDAKAPDRKTMRLDYRGRETKFDQDIVTQTFAGTGGLEGSGVAGGRRKQLVIGEPGYIAPILIDELENVWFVSANAPASWSALENGSDPPRYTPHDGGVPLLANGLFASAADIFTEPVDLAQYQHWAGTSGQGPVYVKLGSEIRIEHRYPAVGAIKDPPDQPARAWTVVDFAVRAGITDADPDNLPEGSAALDAGNRLIEMQKYAEVMADVSTFQVAAIGFTPLDKFFAQPILPSTAGSDAVMFAFVDGVNSRAWVPTPFAGLDRRIYKLTVRAGDTTQGALAGAADDAARDALSRGPKLTNFVAVAQSVLDADSGAKTAEIQIAGNEFSSQADMEAFALRWFAIRGAKNFPLWLEAKFGLDTMALRLLHRVTASSPRFGCTPPRTARIWAIDMQLKRRVIRFGLCSQTDVPSTVEITEADDAVGAGGNGAGTGVTGTKTSEPTIHESFVIACSDETTALTAGTGKRTFFMPYDFTVTEVQAALVTAQASGNIFTVDINDDGTSILSTKLTIDNTESTSITAATPPVLSSTLILKGSKVTFDIDQIGNGSAKGLIVTLIGYRA